MATTDTREAVRKARLLTDTLRRVERTAWLTLERNYTQDTRDAWRDASEALSLACSLESTTTVLDLTLSLPK